MNKYDRRVACPPAFSMKNHGKYVEFCVSRGGKGPQNEKNEKNYENMKKSVDISGFL